MLRLVVVIAFLSVQLVNGRQSQIHEALRKVLETQANEPVNIMIRLVQGTDPVLAQFNTREFTTREERLTSLMTALEDHARRSQEPVLRVLNGLASTSPNLRIEPYWISNQISVRGAHASHVQALIDRCSEIIGQIRLEKILPLPVIQRAVRDDKDGDCESAPTSDTWGISAIQAKAAWALNGKNGAGITVSHIDTGVLWTHVAVKNNFRGGDYAWYDPKSKTKLPYDEVGHGTHTMGTMVGSPNIGVAPGAKWIACQGCRPGGCSEADLNACGQWILCPTHPDGSKKDCSKAPNLVSNSWGTNEEDDFYLPIVKTWLTGNIFPLFANGNAGPNCSTVGSPGGYTNVVGVGAARMGTSAGNYQLATFSSRGPVPSRPNRIKPDVSAPGQAVTSAWNTGNSCFLTISGTSMATPHAAGIVALILAANSTLDYSTIRTKLVDGCTNSNLDTSKLNPCETTNPPEPPFQYPNNEFGQGLVNAPRSVVLVRALK